MFSTGGTIAELTSRTLVMTPENRIVFVQEYEIVGIYTAPEWTPGQQSFTAETIFVPKASVPDAERYESDYAAFLNALELENGASEAFLEYMAAQGMPDSFICFDQQYSALETSIEALTQNSTRLLVLSCGAGLRRPDPGHTLGEHRPELCHAAHLRHGTVCDTCALRPCLRKAGLKASDHDGKEVTPCPQCTASPCARSYAGGA